MEAACFSESHRFTSHMRVDFSLGYVWIVQVFGYLLMDYAAVLFCAE